MSDTFFPAFEAAARSPDPCAGKSGNPPESAEAFEHLLPTLTEWRSKVLEFVRSGGERGATPKEFAVFHGVPLHFISGRFSEVQADGLIVKTHRRREHSAVRISREAFLKGAAGG